MTEIKIGLVGCGEHSYVHAAAARSLQGMKITACCDINEERAAEWARRYSCKGYYNGIEAMLEKERLDAVILCTWPGQHLEQIEKCLSYGIRNILCEKSLALSGAEALSIWNMVKSNDAFLMEGCKNRFHPATRKIEELLAQGENGPVESIRATFDNYEPEEDSTSGENRNWRERKECGGGVAYDWLSYLVNACNHFSGGSPRQVYATGDVSERYGIVNRIYGMIEYDNGIVGHVESSKKSSFSQELQITCAKGTLRLPVAWGIYGDVKLFRMHRKQEWDYILTDVYEIEDIDAFRLQLENFADVIRGGKEPLMPLRQSVENVFTIDALVTSMMEKKVVKLELPDLKD